MKKYIDEMQRLGIEYHKQVAEKRHQIGLDRLDRFTPDSFENDDVEANDIDEN